MKVQMPNVLLAEARKLPYNRADIPGRREPKNDKTFKDCVDAKWTR